MILRIINNHNNDYYRCQESIKKSYNDIYLKKYLYFLTITISLKDNNKPKTVYELYYSSDNNSSFYKLDLNKLNDNCFLKTPIIKCSFYSIESILNDKCILCESDYGYFPINDNSNYFVNCSKSNEKNNTKNESTYEIEYSSNYINNTINNQIINTIYNNLSIINKTTENNNFNTTEIDNVNTDDNNIIYNINNSTENVEIFQKIVCPEEKPYELIETQKCIENCSISDMFNNICKINYKEENKTKKEDLGKKIIEEILNGNLGDLIEQILINKTDIIINEDYAIHQITGLNSQMNNKNLSSLNFGKCQELLKNTYNIKDEEELIIYKIEHKIEGFNIPIIEYILFTQNGSINLNLSICDNTTIQYDIPVSINMNDIDKYDPSSDYYNDQCNKYSTNESVDMTLYERKNKYNNNNMSLCESKCVFKGYNSSTSKAICDCHIKNDMTYSYELIDTNNLLNQIESEKSSSNLGVTQCLNVFGDTDEIKANSGFYTLLIILIIFVIVFIIFCIKGRNLIVKKIDDVIYKKFEKNKKENIHKKNTNTILDNNFFNNNKALINFKQKKKRKKNAKSHTKTNSKFNLKGNKESIMTDIVLDKFENNKISKFNQGNIISNKKEDKLIILQNIPDTENDYEMNNLSYIDALKYDKRSCSEYYGSLIKNKQLFAFTFCSFNDYNSGIIKKFILFLSFALHYTINALFFNDTNMHQIYEDEGKYNFSYQFPKILISAISSTIILRIILQTLVLTDKSILQVKYQPTRDLALDMKIRILKCINIKYAVFFILNFILLVLFWFYLTCFNAKYANTQVYLIENTFISFGISLVYPFIINIIPACLRISSLEDKSKVKSCLYSASQIMQLIFV